MKNLILSILIFVSISCSRYTLDHPAELFTVEQTIKDEGKILIKDHHVYEASKECKGATLCWKHIEDCPACTH